MASGTIIANGTVTQNSKYFLFYVECNYTQNISTNTTSVILNSIWATTDTSKHFFTGEPRSASITYKRATDASAITVSQTQNYNTTSWYNGTYVVQNLPIEVVHNADGTASFTVSARANGYCGASSGTGASTGPSNSSASSGDCVVATTTITLPTIDQRPYATTMPNITIGESLTIGLFNPQGKTCTVEVLSASNTVIGSATTSTTSVTGFNATAVVNAFYASIPNAKSGTYKVRVTSGTWTDTRSGGRYTVNTSVCSPAIGSLVYESTTSAMNTITGDNQKIVSGKCAMKFTASSVNAYYSATVSSVAVSINNIVAQTMSGSGGTYTYSRSAMTLGEGLVPVKATVTDSRGLTATMTIYMTVLSYKAPSGIVTLQRENNFYSNTTIKCDADYSPLNNGNTISISYACTKEGDQSASVSGTLTDNVAITKSLDNQYAWTVVFTLTDRVGTVTTITRQLGKGTPIIYFDRHNTAVGVGEFPSEEKVLEIADDWKLKANGKYAQMAIAPYSFVTNGGQTGTPQAGYARVARVNFNRTPSGVTSSHYAVVKFEIVSTRGDEAELTLRFPMLGYNMTPPLYVALKSGQSSSELNAYIQRVETSTWDVYFPLFSAYDNISVLTKLNEYARDYMDVTYMHGFVATANRPAEDNVAVRYGQVAPFLKVVASGKDSIFNYMPYSWEAHSSEDPQTAGYMRIATVKITGTYAMNSIVFRVQFRGSAYVSNLYLAFTSTASGTEPTVSSFTWDGYRICDAYVKKSETETYTWDVYVAKQTANEYATVRVYTSANFMAKGNITYSPTPVVTEVPSGATVATMPVTPPIQLQASQYYNDDKYGINMRNSDLIGANGIWFADTANARDEGIIYVRSNGNYDTLYALDGDVYLRRNQQKNGTVVAGTRLLTVDDIPRDYVIAEWTEAWGSWGTWYCVAWNSGKRECYGTFSYAVPANGWSAWGNVYEAQPTTAMTISYPGSFFSSAPTLFCSVSGSAGAIGYELYGSNSKTTGPKVIVLRPNSLGSATTYYIHLHAIGPA